MTSATLSSVVPTRPAAVWARARRLAGSVGLLASADASSLARRYRRTVTAPRPSVWTSSMSSQVLGPLIRLTPDTMRVSESAHANSARVNNRAPSSDHVLLRQPVHSVSVIGCWLSSASKVSTIISSPSAMLVTRTAVLSVLTVRGAGVTQTKTKLADDAGSGIRSGCAPVSSTSCQQPIHGNQRWSTLGMRSVFAPVLDWAHVRFGIPPKRSRPVIRATGPVVKCRGWLTLEITAPRSIGLTITESLLSCGTAFLEHKFDATCNPQPAKVDAIRAG